jgi:hypothetical protein
MDTFHKLPFASLLDVCWDTARKLVGDSGMIRTQMGEHNRLVNGRGVFDTLCDTTVQQ